MDLEYAAAIRAIHKDYYNNSMSYENHSPYDCLKAYQSPFGWRPNKLIMVTSDAEPPNDIVNSSILLFWRVKDQLASGEAHFLCNDCASPNPQDIGPFIYKGFKIDYCLYKATDSSQSTVNKCHLQCSPHLLLGKSGLSALPFWKAFPANDMKSLRCSIW